MKHAVLLAVALFALHSSAADTNALTLVRTIPLPDVRGRIDHLALDAPGQRLFVAALGNNTVEVIDLAANRRVRTVGDCSEPQGLAFIPAENRLVIANGGSGVVRILDAASFKTIKAVTGLPDADNVRYDTKSDLIYVGYGEGALAVIKAATGKQVANLTLAGHPESFQIERNGSRIFVNVPEAQQVAVVDRDRHAVVATWPMTEFQANFPMALDEVNHRVFVGCRRPARLVVLETTTGKMVDSVKLSGDTDDLFYDADRRQIYASCGAGFVDVIEQRNPDSYRLRERVPAPGGARTSCFSKARGELYLAVRAGLISGGAEIRVYQCH